MQTTSGTQMPPPSGISRPYTIDTSGLSTADGGIVKIRCVLVTAIKADLSQQDQEVQSTVESEIEHLVFCH